MLIGDTRLSWTRWLGRLLFFGTVFFLSMIWVTPYISIARGPARKAQCLCNVQNITLALWNYRTHYGALPPANVTDESGRLMHSWRVLLLPFLFDDEIYAAYNFAEPWDGLNNRILHDRIPSCYFCAEEHRHRPSTSTNYVAVVGPGTPWAGSANVNEGDTRKSPSGRILFLELQNSGVHWMEPRDLPIHQLGARRHDLRPHMRTGHAGLTNGNVLSLDSMVSDDEIIASVLGAR